MQHSQSGVDKKTSIFCHDRLKEDHLPTIYQTLYNCVKWRNIGIFLHLDRNKLDVIAKEKDDVHSCVEGMLSLWLKRIDPVPTKTDLLRVLRYPQLGLTDEAKTLEDTLKV